MLLPKRSLLPVGFLIVATFVIALLSLAPARSATAAEATNPSVRYTSPSPGQQFTGGKVVVSGTYASNERVTDVTLAVCRPASPTTCRDYLVGATNGAFTKLWNRIPAKIVPASADGRTGTFRIELMGLPSAPLRVAAYATDISTTKGPRALVDVSVTGLNPASYVTVLFGRANWTAAAGDGCTVRPAESRTLEQNAQDLASRGLTGVAQVVTSRIAEDTRLCPDNFAIEASWKDLARLRDTYGWSVTSQSKTYPNLTKLTDPAAVLAESKDTLPIFKAHGHFRAWGSFAYPNNKQNAFVQGLVTDWFGFGRVYSSVNNSKKESLTAPYPMRALSVNGGRCHNTALPCYTMPMVNNRSTTSPTVISRMLRPGPDHWGVVQFYRIVEGKFGQIGTSFAWDCTSPNWGDRWTSQPELYCRNSMLEAIDQRNKSATAVDPAQVALNWGRIPPR